jgi:hypothetical protein
MNFAVSLQTATACAERIVDIPGYLPFVSTITLPLRVTIAAFQTLCALGCAITLGYYDLKRIKNPNQISNENYNELSRHMAYFASNAFQNIIRGLVEYLPVSGSLACYLWDFKKSLLPESELCAIFGPTNKGDWHRPVLFAFIESTVKTGLPTYQSQQ